MELNVLHLFNDLMNLYGESGNVRALCRHLADQGYTVNLLNATLGDVPDFAHADMIYMGCGTERNARLALEDLKRHGEAFGDALERKVPTLFTGNAFHLIGETITDGAGTCFEGLGVFPFQVLESARERYTNDALAKCSLFPEKIVGFLNKCAQITGINFPMFHMEMGEGNNAQDRREGIHFTSFYGTQITGPVLVKNPAFMKHLVMEICARKGPFQYRELEYPYESGAYESTLKALEQRFASGLGEQRHH